MTKVLTVWQILLIVIIENVWRTVWRIYILILGFKGLKLMSFNLDPATEFLHSNGLNIQNTQSSLKEQAEEVASIRMATL